MSNKRGKGLNFSNPYIDANNKGQKENKIYTPNKK